MPCPFFYIYSPDDFVEGLPNEQGAQAAGTPIFTLTLKSTATPTLIEITDNDTVFDEVDPSQSVTNTINFDGDTITAGTIIYSAYDLINTGTGHKVTSFHFGGNGYQQGAVDGIASTVELQPGTAYTFNRERTSHQQNNQYTDFVTCFTAGTQIATPSGTTSVEALRPGDLLCTLDHGAQPVRTILRTDVSRATLQESGHLAPIRIAAGALGQNLPTRDLLVSPQHRFLVNSPIVQRMFPSAEILVSARKLCALEGVEELSADEDVTYFHVVLDGHEVIFAEGAPAESFYLGDYALEAMPPEHRTEIMALFPGEYIKALRSPARPIPAGKHQRMCTERHLRNGKPPLARV